MKKGTILDMLVEADKYGPGLRLVLLMKGCPLRCVWCNQAEARSMSLQLSFNRDRCQNCFSCLTACKNGVHQVIDDQHCVNHEKCQVDGYCVKTCPFDALSLKGMTMTAEETMKIILENFYSEGYEQKNLTLSGGEPMQQFEFSKDILSMAREDGFNTCLDTSGYASKAHFEEILPLVDLFLFDYKETNPQRHLEFTGVKQHLILDNLQLLIKHNKSVVLRCPIIPGYNDHEEHFEGVASLSQKFELPVNILPYERLDPGKIKSFGIDNPMADVMAAEEATLEQWTYILKKKGCLVLEENRLPFKK